MKFNNQCPICLEKEETSPETGLNAHHLISRRVYKYRWDLDNGILLCPKHHEFDLEISAHTAPWAIEEWIKLHMPEKYEIWVRNRQDLDGDGIWKYEEIYHRLEEQHKKQTGEYYMIKRLNMYFLSLHKPEIILAKKMQGVSVSDLAKKYNVSDSVMKKFLGT